MPRYAPALAGLVLLAGLIGLTAAARSQPDDEDRPDYPTSEFAEGATTASVTAGDITAMGWHRSRWGGPTAKRLEHDTDLLFG